MKRENQLLFEPRPNVQGIQESAAAALKSLLFVVHDDDSLNARLQAALSTARACSAHLHLLSVIPLEAYTVVDAYGGTFVSGAIVQAFEDQADKVRRALEAQLRKEDVAWTYEIATAPTLPEIVRSSAFADLLFIGRQPREHECGRTGPGLLGALLHDTQTPLCIPGDDSEGLDPFGSAVIAWNGSIEAANAVRASVGLLRMSSNVRIVRFTEASQGDFPDTRLLEYLSRHGVSAVLDSKKARADIARDLVEYARVFGAEYLVLGGYSRSRAGEFLFGGVTRDLLHACPVSLVTTH